MLCVFFFFKQKTAYELRISDWSSDVCSSDLTDRLCHRLEITFGLARTGHPVEQEGRELPRPDRLYQPIGHRALIISQFGLFEIRIGGYEAAVDRDCHRFDHALVGKAPQHPLRNACRSEEHTSELQSLMRI